MNLPRKLKDMVVHGNGEAYIGESKIFTRPPLEMEGEDWRGSGMIAPIKIFTGLQALEVEHTYGGEIPGLNSTFAEHQVDASQLRFTGAYQNAATGEYDHVEIVVRGRTYAIDAGGDEISSPVITAQEFLAMEAEDCTAIAGEIASFLLQKRQKAEAGLEA